MASKWVCVWVISMVVIGASIGSEGAITCGQVASGVSPCIGYVMGTAPAPPTACCSGISNLNKAAKTTADRQAVCNCLKNAAGSISGINLQLAAGLPKKCGVNIPFKIDPNIDCSKVK